MNNIEHLKNILETKTGLKISIEFTDNRKHILKIKPDKTNSRIIEINSILTDVPDEIIEAITNFIRGNNKKSSRTIILRYVRKVLSEKVQTRKMNMSAVGSVYNLNDIFEKLNSKYFNGLISSRITFGKNYRSIKKRSIVFGTYDPQKNIIRINRALDNAIIPEFFVEYIVFHEMLHACMYFSGISAVSMGHSRKFRSKEKIYPFLEKAKKWKKENLKFFIKPNEKIQKK